ncbi:peptidase S8/S53 domain-containing protein [Chytridium lagenaria]|nr:peptidase S8/S53 domain-containing protein [Chytridium lagenaria]
MSCLIPTPITTRYPSVERLPTSPKTPGHQDKNWKKIDNNVLTQDSIPKLDDGGYFREPLERAEEVEVDQDNASRYQDTEISASSNDEGRLNDAANEYGVPPSMSDSFNSGPFSGFDAERLSRLNTHSNPTKVLGTPNIQSTDRPLDILESVAYPHKTLPATTIKWTEATGTLLPTKSLDDEPDSPIRRIFKIIKKHMAALRGILTKYLESGKQVSPELQKLLGVQDQFDSNIWAGYAGSFPKEIIDALQNSSVVEYVEPNRVIKAAGFRYKGSKSSLNLTRSFPAGFLPKTLSSVPPPTPVTATPWAVKQPQAAWSLDRIGHAGTASLGLFRHFENGGQGVDIYVLDTGIRVSHTIAGGKTFGVAKSANIIAVKYSAATALVTNIVLRGLQWTIERIDPAQRSSRREPCLGGGGISKSLHEHVDRIVALGGVVAVAAGNANTDACANSPADSPNVMTVGATTKEDVKASFSNFGECISLYAPGKEIQSAGFSSDSAVAYESGTSQASPLVAGVLAIYLSIYPNISVQDVYTTLLGSSFMNITLGQMTRADPNILLSAAITDAVNVDLIKGTGTMQSLVWNMMKMMFD